MNKCPSYQGSLVRCQKSKIAQSGSLNSPVGGAIMHDFSSVTNRYTALVLQAKDTGRQR